MSETDSPKDVKKASGAKDKEIYSKYSSKYGFPEFEKVQKFLELSCLDDNGLLLIHIKKNLSDKISSYIDILDPIVHPDSSANSIYENNFFSEDEKNRIFNLFRKLMVLDKEAGISSLDESDEANAKFIKKFFDTYPEIKRELEKILNKEKESWQKEEITKIDRVGYLG
jgi:hypothetical protein